MIIPDVNLLIYAYDSLSPFHEVAAQWWRKCLSEPEPVGLAPVVVFGFLRLMTRPGVFQHPLTPAQAAGHIRSWLAQPCVQVLEPVAGSIEAVLKLVEGLGTAGNLVTDAEIAALAMDYRAVLHTADTDFARFAGLRVFNPITGASSAKPRKS